MSHQIAFALENTEIVQQTYDFVLSNTSRKYLFDLETEGMLSSLIDRSLLQESFSFRSLSRARQLANLLIDNYGKLDQRNLRNTISILENTGFVCYPTGYSDCVITEHEIAVLQQFTSEKMEKLLYRFGLPICHKAAEAIVFDTLGIPVSKLSTADIRRAVLCASLTPLRQNIGSCFATAPGILVQKEQLALFLIDLYQLLHIGQLKRTHNGNEYVVSMSTGYVSMYSKQKLHKKKAALLSPGILQALKACDVIDQKLSFMEQMQQMQTICLPFLSASICIADLFQKVLEQKNISDIPLEKRRMEAAFTSLCENALLKSWEFTLASFSEADPQLIHWHLYTALGFSKDETGGLGVVIYNCLQNTLKTYHQEIESLQKECETTSDQLRAVQSMLHASDATSRIRSVQAEYQSHSHHLQACIDRRDQLIEKANNIGSLFSLIIQYYLDQFPQYFQEMYDPQLTQQNEEDAPAGFRLFYKHGRADASLWTSIETEKEFHQALRSFFLATESLLFTQAKEQKILTEVITAILSHLHDNAFFSSAQKRMNSKEPWCYISGGTMQTLVQNYFCNTIAIENRIVESPLELCIFLLDTLKELPPTITDAKKMLLMNSPGHAFLLLPSEPLFQKGWQDNGFTYTWIRDEFIIPNTKQILLSSDMQHYLLQQVSSYTNNYQHLQTPQEWRDQTLLLCPTIKADDLDAFLYQQLPLIPLNASKEYLYKLLASVWTPSIEEIVERFTFSKTPFIPAAQIKRIAKGCLLLAQDSVGFSFDVHSFITNAACEIGLSSRCLIFADTNWPGFYFGFVMNPGTGNLELWRFDRSGTFGYPMSSWKKWLGSEKKSWSVYINPFKYLFSLHSYGIS